jgi:hypothetical protein
MVETLKTLLGTLLLLFRSRSRLQVEILVLRQQLNVLRRTAPKRVRLRAMDRLLFVLLYRLWPGILDSIVLLRPDTIVRWHRRVFRALWWWKSRRRLGRPGIDKDTRDLIREFSCANPLWGAPAFMVNCSNSGSRSPNRQWRSTCRGSGDRRRNPGGSSCPITPRRLPPFISSSFRQSH